MALFETFALMQSKKGVNCFFLTPPSKNMASFEEKFESRGLLEKDLGQHADKYAHIANLKWLPGDDSGRSDKVMAGRREFPDFMNSFNQLKRLEMAMFFGSGQDDMYEIPTRVDLQHLVSLTHLDISQNCLQVMPENLSLLVNLRFLNISHNKFIDIDTDFSGMQHLTDLFIEGGSQDGDVEYRTINKSVCKLLNLEVLSFQMTRMMSLPDDIGNLEKLKSLNLQGSCLDEIPESITKLTNLVELLAYGVGLKSLPKNFGNLKSLQTLELKANCDVLVLPESFIELTQLVDLSLPSSESLVKPSGYDNFLWKLGRSGCEYEESDC